MNTDIRVKIGLHDHPKYKKLKKNLGKSPMEYLIIFWSYVAAYAPTGELSGWTPDEIEEAANWEGKKGVFCKALLDCGFIDAVEDGFYPHDWHEHQTWVVRAQERSEKARRAVTKRWDTHSNTTSNTHSNATSNSKRITNVYTPSPSPLKSKDLKSKEETFMAAAPTSTNGAAADKKLLVSDIQDLMRKYMGKLVISGGQIELIRQICSQYSPEAITNAFEAAGGIGNIHSLNWIVARLEGRSNTEPIQEPFDITKDYAEGTFFHFHKQSLLSERAAREATLAN